MIAHSRRPSLPRVLPFLAILSAVAIWGCAKPVVYPEWVASVEIDLEPRCVREVDRFVRLEQLREPATGSAFKNSETELSPGVRWFVDSAPRSGLATLSWGFPGFLGESDSVSDSDLRLAAALMLAGETTSDPEAFRGSVLGIGATLAVHVDEGWLWLEFRFPELKRARAMQLFSEWIKPEVVSTSALDRTRRQVALVRLAEEASPKTLAERLFRRLNPPPVGAAMGRTWRGNSSQRTPEQIQVLLESILQIDGSVVVYSGSEHADFVRAVTEAKILERSAVVIEPTSVSRSSPPLTEKPSQEDGSEIYIVDRPGSAQVEVLVGYSTVAPLDPDHAVLEMLASLLGGNVGGRLFRDLRERQGLAYIVNAEQNAEGRFVVSTRARHERIVALLQGIEAHFRALVDTPLKTCEVEMLRNRMRGESILLADDPRARSEEVRFDLMLLGKPRSDSPTDRFDIVALRSELQEVAQRHFKGAPTVVLVGDAAWLENDLSHAFPRRGIRVLDSELD